MKWVEKSLDELGTVGRGRSRHRPRNAPHLYGGSYPFVQTGDVKHAGLYLHTYEQTYNDAGLAQSKLWPAGTLCITIAANIADTAVLGIDACFPDSVIGFLANSEHADARYIKYLFDALLKRRYRNFSQGVAQDNLSQEKLLSIKLRLPERVEDQTAIADILAAYDMLIANNEARIALLERSARLRFAECFIRSCKPDLLPVGWTTTTPGQLIQSHIGGGWGQDEPSGKETEPGFVIRGTDIPDIELGAIDAVGLRYHSATALRGRKLVDFDVVFEVSGGSTTQPVARTLLVSPERLNVWDRDVMCASFCKRLTFSSPYDALYFYFHTREFRERGPILVYQKESASSLKNFNFQGFLDSYRIPLPPADLRKEFFDSTIDLHRQQVVLGRQNQALSRARDCLLPRAMEGRIAV